MPDEEPWIYDSTGLPVEVGLPPSTIDTQRTTVMGVVSPPTRRWRRRLRRFALACLALVVVLAGSVGFMWFNPPALGWLDQPFFPSVPGAVPWNGSDPINILAIGEDQRYPGEPTQADTMIVISLDPGAKTVRLVSIPRDLAVTVPEYQAFNKINEANFRGGPQFAAFTLEYALGIPINYYLVLRFQTFKTVIDALGGVNMTVDQQVDDPTYPALQGNGYAPLHLKPGPQHMDGATALAYVRERHAYADGDAARNLHQQQLISALKAQMLGIDTALHLPSIVSAVQSAFQTNIPGNMLPVVLLDIMRSGSMQHEYFTVANHMVTPCEGYDAGADLCPTSALKPRVAQLFHDQQLADEQASVLVQNGSTFAGKAEEVATALTASDFVVAGTGPSSSGTQAHTTVIINSAVSAAPYTTRLLRQMFQAQLLTRSMPEVKAQLVLLLGNDAPHRLR